MKVEELKALTPLDGVYELSPRCKYLVIFSQRAVSDSSAVTLILHLRNEGLRAIGIMTHDVQAIRVLGFPDDPEITLGPVKPARWVAMTSGPAGALFYQHEVGVEHALTPNPSLAAWWESEQECQNAIAELKLVNFVSRLASSEDR
jgi:hypothetical protein